MFKYVFVIMNNNGALHYENFNDLSMKIKHGGGVNHCFLNDYVKYKIYFKDVA